MRILTCFLVLMSLVSCPGFASDFVINEIMSSNESFLADEDGDYSDWIELYNGSDSNISLSGYYLSDKSGNKQLWQFPDTSIGVGQYLIVFASGKDRREPGKQLHTSFSIKADGEILYLSDANTTVFTMPAAMLSPNESFGLNPDSSKALLVFSLPTPGKLNSLDGERKQITFSAAGGIYQSVFDLTLTNSNQANSIYYSTDGSTPTLQSKLCNGVLTMSKNMWSEMNINQLRVSPEDLYYPPTKEIPKAIVIRAASFDPDGNRIGSVITNSYFIRDLDINHLQLPIISICADYADLFDSVKGIMVPGVNWKSDNPNWSGNYYIHSDLAERIINLEYYDAANSKLSFNQLSGIRVHGGNCRRFPQKGFKVYAREEYSLSKFNVKMFNDRPTKKYKGFVFKPFSGSWYGSGYEDYVANKAVARLNVDHVATKPAVLYLNGEYWGIYYIQERIDEHTVANNNGANKDSVDIIEGWYGEIAEGNNDDFLAMYDFVEKNDLSSDENYAIISNILDIDSFIDYEIFEILIMNVDWPAGNTKIWHDRSTNSKWRFFFCDGDAAFYSSVVNGFEHATSVSEQQWPTNARSTLFLRKLLANQRFKDTFKHRIEEILNSILLPDVFFAEIDSVTRAISGELMSQIDRFAFPKNQDAWQWAVNCMNYFCQNYQCDLNADAAKFWGALLDIKLCPLYTQDDSPLTSVSVVPNPNNGNFNLEFNSSDYGNGEIRISDMLGKTVYVTPIVLCEGRNSISLRDTQLSGGIYIVSIVTENGSCRLKMICLN